MKIFFLNSIYKAHFISISRSLRFNLWESVVSDSSNYHKWRFLHVKITQSKPWRARNRQFCGFRVSYRCQIACWARNGSWHGIREGDLWPGIISNCIWESMSTRKWFLFLQYSKATYKIRQEPNQLQKQIKIELNRDWAIWSVVATVQTNCYRINFNFFWLKAVNIVTIKTLFCRLSYSRWEKTKPCSSFSRFSLASG